MSEQANTEAAVGREARKWATICHLAALVGLLGNGIGFLVGPLAVWLVKREDDPFVDEQGKEAVNFQITMFLAAFVSALLILIVIGIVMLIVVGLMMVIFPIIAAIKANDGLPYRYPLSIRFIK
jgi:uncharacterized Tic20 family protein